MEVIAEGIVRSDGQTEDVAPQIVTERGPFAKKIPLRLRLGFGLHMPRTPPPTVYVEQPDDDGAWTPVAEVVTVPGATVALDLIPEPPWPNEQVRLRWECSRPQATTFWVLRVTV